MSFAPEDMDTAAALDGILAELRRIVEVLERIESRPAAVAGAAPSGGGGEVASDADLDSKWGDVEIKRNPSRWKGPSFEGKHMSECSPEFLDCLAELYDWKAANPRGYGNTTPEKAAQYARKDAARARGWAARIRNGWKPKTTQPEPLPDGEIPF